LDLYEDPSQLVKLNPEDAFESARALVIGKMGRWEEAKSMLKDRILEAEDNLFSMLRYLELGMETDLDPDIKEICVEYLIEYAPPPFEYAGTRGMGIPGEAEDLAPSYYQDCLRAMAEGHLASAQGDHEKAMEAYRHAAKAARFLRFHHLGAMPTVTTHLGRVLSQVRSDA